MSLTPGARIGVYEIVGLLGVGGMGEVYRARDTRLKREVAIKVLPDAVAQDHDRLARFQREAELLATLNHPNIAQIHGLEEADGLRALVLELVEGPTLADRIAQGPIPIGDALPLARQIAEALEAAHELGIIHRDLKPANVNVRVDGTVKVLDFGLAKARNPAPGAIDVLQSPTITSPAMTGVGMILGTAAYMSPEQAKGRAADKRSDVWAFGCVLFEMLSGKRAFEGEDVSDTLANVLKTQPDWNVLPDSTPPAIRRLLRRSLEKDRTRRLADIADARFDIEEALTTPVGDVPQPVSVTQGRFPWGWLMATAVLAGAVLVLGLAYVRKMPTEPPRTTRFQVPLPEKATEPMFHLSPDGRTLAITATEGGRNRLWVRPLDSLDAHALPGTDEATYPFWSPDSAFIGFFAQGKLKKIALAGGPPQTVCEAPNGRGGTWNANGVIVFASLGSGLSRVASAGGVPAPVTKPATGESHRFPEFLPGGRRFLFSISLVKPDVNGIYVGSLDGTPPVRILPDESNAVYVPPDTSSASGHLLFRREATLMAQPFDPGRLTMSGDVFPLAQQVPMSANAIYGAFSVSENGVLAFVSGLIARTRELVWMDRTGKRLGTIGQPDQIFAATLSPDEKRIAVAIVKPESNSSDLWLYDVDRGRQRFTFRPGLSSDGVWSPDGGAIVFGADVTSLYQKRVGGAGDEELLLRSGINTRPLDWSRDGRVVYQTQSGGQTDTGQTGLDLFLLPLGDRRPVPYPPTRFNQGDAQFSPDGRWMAYASDDSGQVQVHVQAIPADGDIKPISTGGGDQPRWRRDGKELFYISTDQKLMAVPVKTDARFEAGPPQPLFDIQPVYPALGGRFAYQPTRDGQRFLVTAPVSGAPPPITVVLNWQAGLKK